MEFEGKITSGDLQLQVNRYAEEGHCRAPTVSVRKDMVGCCYNAFRDRICVGDDLLKAEWSELRVILAHEVGHARQRGAILRDVCVVFGLLLLVGLGALAMAAKCKSSTGYLVTSVVTLAAMSSITEWSKRWYLPRYRAREYDADVFSAKVCGVEAALSTMLNAGGDCTPEFAMRIEHLQNLSAQGVGFD